MLERSTILAMFFLVGLMPYPKVPGHGSQKNQPAQAKNDQGQTLSQPCICNIQVQESPTKQAENSQPKPYQWRELYAPANVPNWVLALLAGWAGLMALKTLRAINDQANAFIGSERPWILVSIKGHQAVEGHINGTPVKRFAAQIILTNYGRGPAFIRDAKCGGFICKSPSDVNESLFEKITGEFQTGNVRQLSIPPGDADESLRVVSQDALDSSHWRELASATIKLLPIYCGVIRYDDPYGKNRETRFCLMPDGGNWRIMGTSEMNACT